MANQYEDNDKKYEVKTKGGYNMVVYTFGGKTKFTQKEKYNPYVKNARDVTFEGTPEEARDYLQKN
jgi:hypothetical protein